MDLLFGPDRFREVLVMLFTSVGDQPGEIARLLLAWLAAILIANWISSQAK